LLDYRTIDILGTLTVEFSLVYGFMLPHRLVSKKRINKREHIIISRCFLFIFKIKQYLHDITH